VTAHKKTDAYQHASGGWGSVNAVVSVLIQEKAPVNTSRVLVHQNKPDGFMCVSCSWAKPAHPHPFEFCESGAKATAWDTTSKRVAPEFFQQHTVRQLEQWHDHDLEEAGRLVAPLRYDAITDRYVEVKWDRAFAEIARELNALEPDAAVFYTSGRASLDTAYMYQLFARMYGTNNLPDSSNMCHESTSVGLTEAIGVGVGTITPEGFKHTDLIFFFGHNVGTNSPRMLHDLQDARHRGVPIITFNPIREPGLVSFVNPQSPAQMLTPGATRISTQYLQVNAGGDSAAIAGICKALIAVDDHARANGAARVLDTQSSRSTRSVSKRSLRRCASWTGMTLSEPAALRPTR
jgi:formate dehydrogenase major subunit